MNDIKNLKFKVDVKSLVDGIKGSDGLPFRDHKIGLENIIHGLSEENKRKPLTETVEEMENGRLISVVYSDEFLEIFYTLDYVVNTYENMHSVSNAMQHARFILDQYKDKFNLNPEDFE